ncbi:MAG TPA: PAS domain S-box protein [Burkholderiaceae bacterium]|nr:PAS domain S-box protein [Burkholderiaceae bacterium]
MGIVEFNAAAERTFGYRREDVMGRMVAEVLLPPRRRAAHARALERFRSGERVPMVGRPVEITGMHADGREIPVEMAVSVAEVPEGTIFVGHVRDIRRRRAPEAERAQLETQLRQAQKMEAIGQLTGGIAHDFNNILTSVIGYLVLGEERAQVLGDDRLQRHLAQAQLAAQRARDLIAQMLAFARRQHGQPRVLELVPLLQQTLGLLRPTMPSSVIIEADLPSMQSAPLAVNVDPVQLAQVLFNLCINARDAMDSEGRISVRLSQTATPAGTAHRAGREWPGDLGSSFR